MKIVLLLALLLSAAVQAAHAGPRRRAKGGGESVYARWSHGPPRDPAWFPIGVWLQDPALAARYAELGVNTYVGLWQGPTIEQLEQCAAAGMRVICAPNDVARERLDDPTIVAWMQMDEPDNHADGRPGPRAEPAEVLERYERLRELDPTRPVWLNLGQGVANDAWKGIGARRDQYPDYVRACDIVSFDVYPVTNLGREDGGDLLWYVGKGVARLRAWSEDSRVVWNFLECTRVKHPTRKPTPTEIRAEAWLALIHGSRGLVWFCHEFVPDVRPAALLEDEVSRAAVAAVNREVLSLAPVLNAGLEREGVEAASARADVPVRAVLGHDDAATYVFAVCLRSASTTATLTVDAPARRVEVLGEGRELPVEGGSFEDEFGPFAVHLYRLR